MSPFGQQTGTGTFSALGNNSFLIRDTTLYCLTENQNDPQVTWTFINTDGHITFLSATTDATTGVSTLNVTNEKPGHYSCKVTQNGGDTQTYTTVMLNQGNFMLSMYLLETSFLYKLCDRLDTPVLTSVVRLGNFLFHKIQIV